LGHVSVIDEGIGDINFRKPIYGLSSLQI
jgi:hypothetical protein